MSNRFRWLLMFVVAVALIYPAFLFGSFLGGQVAELPKAIAERPYSVLFGVAMNLLVLGFLHWLILGRRRTPQMKLDNDRKELENRAKANELGIPPSTGD